MISQTLLKRYERDLVLKGFSPRTRETYYRNIVHFFNYSPEDPIMVTGETIKDYLYYLIKDRKLSPSSLRQARSAITYFFTQTMGSPVEVENIPCQIKERKLPTVYSVNEVAAIINSTSNLKHKTILMLVYSSGLRVGEVVEIKPSDIARDIMRLKIRQAKGHKDRYAILSEVCLDQLEIYWLKYKPENWLFNGKKQGTQISIRAVQHAFEIAKRNAGIKKKGGIHSLRHSFATHMLEAGGGLFQLQKFLGHKHLKTTLIYTHISEENVKAESPLDVYRDRFLNVKTNH
ncbi:site-specific integrase [bacterium]|nr:site-specific integrase [bacterium]